MLRPPDPHGFVHQAVLYRSTEELAALMAPYVRDGVHAGDAVVMVSTPRNEAAVRAALAPREAEQVAFERSSERYADVGPALVGFQDLLAEHTGRGRCVRLIGEPPLSAASDVHRRELCHNDAAANEVIRMPGVAVVCPVDVTATPREAVTTMRRSHPEVVEDGTWRPSPQYTEPAALLAHERRQPLPPPAGEPVALPGPADAAAVRAFVERQLTGMLEPSRRDDFVTAVNEIVINALTHAVIDSLRLWREGGRIVCEVGDAGGGLSDPLAGYRQPEPWQTSGWGLWLARQLTHAIEVSTGTAGSTFRLHTKVSSAVQAA